MIDSPLHRLVAAAAFALLPVATAHAQAEPSDPHPRLFLDERVVAAWRDLAGRSGTTVAAAVRRCDEIARSPSNFRRDIYMGFDWAQHLQACLVAWKATDDTRYAKMAQTYFVALIDDLKEVGDGQGGDRAVQRDSGYAIRAHGPYAAIAYDWLAGAPHAGESRCPPPCAARHRIPRRSRGPRAGTSPRAAPAPAGAAPTGARGRPRV